MGKGACFSVVQEILNASVNGSFHIHVLCKPGKDVLHHPCRITNIFRDTNHSKGSLDILNGMLGVCCRVGDLRRVKVRQQIACLMIQELKTAYARKTRSARIQIAINVG